MDKDVLLALLDLLPQILWFALIVALLIVLGRPLLRELLPRITGLKVPGLELALKSTEIDDLVRKRADEQGLDIEVATWVGEAVTARARRIADVLASSAVLWHDPIPANTLPERQVLHGLGLFVEPVTSIPAAMETIDSSTYGRAFDVVISNIGKDKAGLEFRDALLADPKHPPLVFYVWHLDEKAGTPNGAFAITNRPDELFHLVMDAVERRMPPPDTAAKPA